MEKEKAKIEVFRSELEGECCIEEAYGIRINNLKMVAFFFLAFITGGISLIVCFWHMPSLRYLLFEYCSIEDATYVIIRNWDDTFSINKLNLQPIAEYIEDKNWNKALKQGKVFTNRYLDYIISEKHKKIIPLEFFVNGSMDEVIKNLGKGITTSEASDYQKVFDKCLLELPVPSVFLFAMEEVLNGYFLFQVFSCLVWFNNQYVFFASIILGTSLITAIWNLITARINFINVRNMAEYTTKVQVIRDGNITTEISSVDLVPGDLIVLKDNFKLPCDCILLRGDVLVNECSLTGESLPIMKKSVEAEEEKTVFHPYKSKINMLFEGTLILQSNNRETQLSLAIVLRTRFGSVKGQLVRSILYPKSHKFQFLTQSYKFVFIMALCTLVGFFSILHIFIEIFTPGEIILRLCDLVTISVPPSLPLAMNIGIRISLGKLWKNKIFCIAPKKILVAGNVNMICFDKTGTITEDYMDFGGLLMCAKAFFANKIMLSDPPNETNEENYNYAVDCMATCHAIIRLRSDLAVKASEELFGDVMEMKIFEYTGAQFLDGKEEKDTQTYIRRKNRILCIKKKFEFSSDLQRMSVLCQSNDFDKKRVLFMKGAPEVIKLLARPETIPDNFDGVLEDFTLKGLRVLALAFREFENDDADHFLRADLEIQMNFMGFILLDNKLKSDSLETFRHLNNAQIGCKMVTGDNPLTALSKAKECNIITFEREIYICDVEEGNNYTEKHLKMKREIREVNIDKNSDSISILSRNQEDKSRLVQHDEKKGQKQFEKFQKEGQGNKDINIELVEVNAPSNSSNPIIDSFLLKAREISLKDATFVFTGKAFEEIFQSKCRTRKENGVFLGEIITRAKVFARMKPNQKAVLVELLQKLENTVAMVGDGANDCGALRQADVGLSLSEAEASISAPFTAKDLKVSSVVTLLRYGRSGLISSFESFKYIALYSMIQFISQVILYSYYSTLSEPFFVYQDLFICVTLFSTMSLTDAADVLSVDRITPSLFSLKCIASIMGQVALQTASQIIMLFWLRSIPYYDGENGDLLLKNSFLGIPNGDEWVDGEEDPEPLSELSETGPISTTLFYIGIYLLVGGTICFSIGKPYRKSFYTNIIYTLNIIILYGCNYIFCFVNLDDAMVEKDNGIPVEFVGYTVIIAHVFMLLMFLYERVVVNIFITKIEARMINNRKKSHVLSI